GSLKLLGLVDHHEKNTRACGHFHWAIPPPDLRSDQALLNCRLARHPATLSVNTAIAPQSTGCRPAKPKTPAPGPTLETTSGVVGPLTTSLSRTRKTWTR